MNKTCNLSTVKNTSHEVRKSTSTLDYYYIEFGHHENSDNKITHKKLSYLSNLIFDFIEDNDIIYMQNIYICAHYTDGINKRLIHFEFSQDERSVKVRKVR